MAVPYTTRTQFRRDEAEGIHYKPVDEKVYSEWEKDNLFILDQSVEEGITHASSETAYHTSNPVLKVDKWEKAMGTAHFRHPMHTWKHQGILISDVNKIIAKHKVAMLECEL